MYEWIEQRRKELRKQDEVLKVDRSHFLCAVSYRLLKFYLSKKGKNTERKYQ